jgi:hypothetical protein
MGELDRTRLVRVLGMLGSSELGERANAANFANRIVTDAGLTWGEVLGGVDADGVPLRDTVAVLKGDIERYRQEVARLEAEVGASRRNVRDLKTQLEQERQHLEGERSGRSNPRWTSPETTSIKASGNRPPGWGSDPFGNEPALPKEAVKKRYPTVVRVLFWGVVIVAGISALASLRSK